MTLMQTFDQYLDRLERAWGGLNVREQKILGAGLIFVGICIGWFILLEPALTTLQKVRRDLPETLRQANRAQGIAQEIKQLNKHAAHRVATAENLKNLTEHSLSDTSWGSRAKITENTANAIKIEAQDIPATEAIAWAASMENQPGLHMGNVSLMRTSAGIVDMVAELKRDAPTSP